MPVSITVCHTSLQLVPMRTRMPFRYGIAAVRELQHVILTVTALVDGQETKGLSADHLAPRWFIKDPSLTYEDEVRMLLRAIQHACYLAEQVGEASNPFDFWWEVYHTQGDWAYREDIAPLVASFGASLIERAVVHAFCRAKGVSFGRALRQNMLGVDLGRVHHVLAGTGPKDYLPPQPLRSIIVRHTVGLGDPLTEAEIAPDDYLDDGLPQSLQQCIERYGLTHFKIKLGGDSRADHERLRAIARLLITQVPKFHFSLDANEMYPDIEAFRSFWEQVRADAGLQEFLRSLLFVEQPLARDSALSEQTRQQMMNWRGKPPTIIDESDSQLHSLTAALECGYDGCSVKSCKGIFKGVVNYCLAQHLRSRGQHVLISGEDLTTVPPVSLLQDLALMANLGIDNVERNGHHYFRGLTMLPQDEQERLLSQYPHLFTRLPLGFAMASINEGRLCTADVNAAAYGID